MGQLNKHDLNRALKILPEPVKALLICNGVDLVVAGGFLRSVVTRDFIKDIDLFSTSAEKAKENWEKLAGKSADIIMTDNAYTIKNVGNKTVQFIHKWCYPTPQELINSFDYTIARAAIWWDQKTRLWCSVTDPEFYEDCAGRRLNYKNPNRIEEPAGSLLRMLKFVRKGYSIDNRSLAGVIAKASKAYEPNASFTSWGLDYSATPAYTEGMVYTNLNRITGES